MRFSFVMTPVAWYLSASWKRASSSPRSSMTGGVAGVNELKEDFEDLGGFGNLDDVEGNVLRLGSEARRLGESDREGVLEDG